MPRHPRDKPRPWRRSLAWAALITLVASAIYFSLSERTGRGVPPADMPDVH